MGPPPYSMPHLAAIWLPLAILLVGTAVWNWRKQTVPNVVLYPAATYFIAITLVLQDTFIWAQLAGMIVFGYYAIGGRGLSVLMGGGGIVKLLIVVTLATSLIVGISTFIFAVAIAALMRAVSMRNERIHEVWRDGAVPIVIVALVTALIAEHVVGALLLA